jgi:hypothetical protein
MFGQHKRPTGDPKKNVLLERQQRSARKKATTIVLNIHPSDYPIQQQESSAAEKWMEKIEKDTPRLVLNNFAARKIVEVEKRHV